MRNEQGKVERARDGGICKMEKTETLLCKVGLHCMSLFRLDFPKLIFPTTFYKRKLHYNNLITVQSCLLGVIHPLLHSPSWNVVGQLFIPEFAWRY
jgi:hypothetical protein